MLALGRYVHPDSWEDRQASTARSTRSLHLPGEPPTDRAGGRIVGRFRPAPATLPTPSTKARQWWWPCRPRTPPGVAPGRVHCGTGRLVGPQVAFPSASKRQYQQAWRPLDGCPRRHRRSRASPRGCPPTPRRGRRASCRAAQGPVDRLAATAGRGVGEEHAVTVAQETGDGTHAAADRCRHAPHPVPGLGVAHELDVGGHLVPPARGQDGEQTPRALR